MHHNFVSGDWTRAIGGETYSKVNPWRPSETIGDFAASTKADAEAAVTAADEAFAAWSRLPLATRGSYLMAAADSLERRLETIATSMSTEMGKPLREARGETLRAAQILRFSASEAFRSVGEHFEQSGNGAAISTRRRSLGVVGLITPWNFPIAIPVWKLAPALMYGNTVVLKLAYEAPVTGLHVAEAFAEANLPAGVLNVLTGRGSTAGAALVEDPRVRAISFTGSVATGHGVRDVGDESRQARPARARRPQPADRDGRRRPRPRGRGRLRRRVLVGRPEVHRDAAASTSRTPSTTTSASPSSRGSRAARSATRSTRRPRSARSSTSHSSTRSSPRSSAAVPRAAASSREASAPRERPS